MPMVKGYVRKSLAQRVYEKIIYADDDCWGWSGFKDKAGYARIQYSGREGKVIYVHRWMYEQFVGEIPEGFELDHLCRNRGCVNPAHLEAVTHKENVVRGFSPNVIISRTGKCARGHELNEKNRYWRKDRPGYWNCLECRRENRNRKGIAVTSY